MGKVLRIIFVFVLLFGSVTVGHIHDEKCGYDSHKHTGCIYEVSPYQNLGPGI